MKKILLAAVAAMFLCSGCMELLLLGCNDDNDDCFASSTVAPTPLAPPADTAR